MLATSAGVTTVDSVHVGNCSNARGRPAKAQGSTHTPATVIHLQSPRHDETPEAGLRRFRNRWNPGRVGFPTCDFSHFKVTRK